MYDLPSESNVSKCIISEEVINDNKDPELIRINKKEESA